MTIKNPKDGELWLVRLSDEENRVVTICEDQFLHGEFYKSISCMNISDNNLIEKLYNQEQADEYAKKYHNTIKEKDKSYKRTKPRTKTYFVKVEYSTSWKAAKDHEERVEFLYRQSDLGDAIKGNNWKAIQSPSEAAQYHFDLYRKLETEIDERQEFIDEAREVTRATPNSKAAMSFGMLYDSGKFKLVEK